MRVPPPGMCGAVAPGGSGFLCTLPPEHAVAVHEAWNMAGTILYAQWPAATAKPQVRITDEMVAAADAELVTYEPVTDLRAVLRVAFLAAGFEVIE